MSTTVAFTPLERLRTYASFVRFEHTLFSLPLVLAGVFSQPGPALSWRRWALILAAAAGARTVALALNRLIDRRLDALNPRTRGRELPAGRMRTSEALALLAVSGAVYFAAAAAIDPLCLKLSPIPLAAFAAYPYLKRFTPLCHFGVGAALALAPLAGWVAAHPGMETPRPAVFLALFTLCWVSGFDIIYATLDEAFDRGQGVHSMVAWLGRARALRVSAVLHLLAAAWLVVGVTWELLGRGLAGVPPGGAILTIALASGVVALLGFEQRAAENVDLAFFKVNVVVGFGVLAVVLAARAVAGGF
jgi:4-hydroxybenzoate polyprenyltransferase